MNSNELSGLFINPIALQVRQWARDGKVDEGDFERLLTSDARALVDHSMDMDLADWAPFEAVEGLVALAAEQLGGDAGLVEWAAGPFEEWLREAPVEGLLASARGLVDAPGFVVSQLSELLVRDPHWQYDGGSASFSVRLSGLSEASSGLKSLIGSLLARVGAAAQARPFDVRFEGIDGEAALVVFGEMETSDEDDLLGEGRLHRAALVAG